MNSFFKKNKRKIISAILILMPLIIICIPFFINNIPIISGNTSRIEIVEKIAQIIAALFVIVGTVIAVWQYYVSSKSEIVKVETEKVQTAINLAEYFKNEIIYPYSVVIEVYKAAGIYDFLQKEKAKMKNFDVEEMSDIFSQEELKKLQNKYSSKEFIEKVIQINESFNLQLNGCRIIDNPSPDGNNKVTMKVDINKAMNDFFNNYVVKLLNNVELFAMYFTHNVADESVVYQSLYPAYIEMCRTLYYDISKCSELGKPKLYRNLQGLYEVWLNKSNETKRNIRDEEINNGTIPQNIY
mgnify:CR=1 FL=1